MARWLVLNAGAIGGGALVTAVQHATLGPVLMIAGVLGSLPLLMITTLIAMLALVAVYSPHRSRRGTAEKILERLLAAITRPPQP
ncbi:MAG: hypothetical protein JO281_13980 [Pseudonocardiales bacterium]|nr:hypothetical protein [Pseudonocardiales bacterium]